MTAAASPPAASPPGSRWVLGIALVLSIALIGGVLLAAALIRAQRPAPLPLAAVAAPAAGSPECARLLSAVPQELEGDGNGSVPRRELAAPAPPGAAAWGAPPVVLRCGLARPAALTPTARLLDISGVQFLNLPSPDLSRTERPGAARSVTGLPAGTAASTWLAVDRPVYVAVSLPPDVGSGPLQQIAGVIGQTLPRQDLDLAPEPGR
ncbi:MAG TPA: DUF3515 domain-containing protein [Pseudonocardiaceae bacterium]|nr:DUF3515 domain-containing protein [Pseudonocardiaceae bacterium]